MKFKNIPCDHRMTIRDNKKFLKMETLARYYNDATTFTTITTAVDDNSFWNSKS